MTHPSPLVSHTPASRRRVIHSRFPSGGRTTIGKLMARQRRHVRHRLHRERRVLHVDAGEVEADVAVGLNLAETRQVVFDRVFRC